MNSHSGSCTRAASPSPTRPGVRWFGFEAERPVLVVRSRILKRGKNVAGGAVRGDPDGRDQVAEPREIREVDCPQFPEFEGFAEHLNQGVGCPPPVQVRGYGDEHRVGRLGVGPVVVECDTGEFQFRRGLQRR